MRVFPAVKLDRNWSNLAVNILSGIILLTFVPLYYAAELPTVIRDGMRADGR